MNKCQVNLGEARSSGTDGDLNGIADLLPYSVRDIFGIAMNTAAHEHDRYFRFLRKLRAEGRTNMYGAVPYLMRSFGLDRDRAFTVVCSWIDQQIELGPVPDARPRKVVGRSAA